jgi:ISXO2-like transposase domain
VLTSKKPRLPIPRDGRAVASRRPKPSAAYPHKHADHSINQYVVGAVHTQTIEGFWSLVKGGMVGTFHKVSRKYLPLYVAEFQFRYNNRENENIFAEAIKGC